VLDVFTLALGLGLVFNAAPGAVFTESLRRGVRGGFRPAFGVQVGSLVGDAVWAVLGLAGVGVLFTVPALRVPLTVAGCLLLAWLGVQGIRAAVTGAPAADGTAPGPGAHGALRTGMAMSLANPWNVVYWSGAAGGVSGTLGDRADTTALVVFFTGFMLASLGWCFVCAGAIAGLRRALPPAAVRVVELLCGAALLVFAVLLLGRVAG
jgi:chemosensory pili system protein ChpE